MTRTMHKLTLEIQIDEQILEAPYDAIFLHAAEQNNQLCVWYYCTPENLQKKVFLVCGTGQPAPDNKYFDYIGTAHFSGGRFVFHAFVRNRL